MVIEAETRCHLVTLNKINIRNTSCVLTCESLLLTCKDLWVLPQSVFMFFVWISEKKLLFRYTTLNDWFL
jgi:hypothetical protein